MVGCGGAIPLRRGAICLMLQPTRAVPPAPAGLPSSSSRPYSADGAADAPAAPSTSSPPQAAGSSSSGGGGGGAPRAPRTNQYGPRLVTQLRRGGKDKASLMEGIVHVHCTLNNTILTLTDTQGMVKASSSCGKMGFKNANKSTPLATERAAEDIARKALGMGYGTALVKLNGMGRNKMYAVQALHKTGLSVTQIQDVTPIAYNGCRLPRKRRT
jgi:ribosomal protein uS11